jgi:hypothetical protein
MDPVLNTIIASAADALVGLVTDGIKILIKLKPEARKKLKAVHREIAANKTLLDHTIDKDGYGVNCGTPEFSDLAESLSNAETAPLYKEYKTLQHSHIVKGGKKREQINRIQYALNYTVRQIDDLKILAKQKKPKRLRLSVRLRTLAKHTAVLEKVLRAVK